MEYIGKEIYLRCASLPYVIEGDTLQVIVHDGNHVTIPKKGAVVEDCIRRVTVTSPLVVNCVRFSESSGKEFSFASNVFFPAKCFCLEQCSAAFTMVGDELVSASGSKGKVLAIDSQHSRALVVWSYPGVTRPPQWNTLEFVDNKCRNESKWQREQKYGCGAVVKLEREEKKKEEEKIDTKEKTEEKAEEKKVETGQIEEKVETGQVEEGKKVGEEKKVETGQVEEEKFEEKKETGVLGLVDFVTQHKGWKSIVIKAECSGGLMHITIRHKLLYPKKIAERWVNGFMATSKEYEDKKVTFTVSVTGDDLAFTDAKFTLNGGGEEKK